MSFSTLASQKQINKLKSYLDDSLYKNSFYILVGRILNMGCGFLFWIFAAKLYTLEEVGFATALISSQGIILLFSKFGIDTTLIRFITSENKSKIFNTCLTITTLISLIVGVIYVILINIISPKLAFIQEPKYAILFLFYIIISSITDITNQSLIATKETKHYLIQNMILILRIPFLYLLVSLGEWGIFYSLCIAYLSATIFSLLYLNRFIGFNLKIDREFINKSYTFSLHSYISNVLLALPSLILPIIILNLLNEKSSAIFYMAFNINSLILLFPEALALALFVEGSSGGCLKQNVIKSSIAVYSLLIPIVFIMYTHGDFVLNFLGKEYLEAFNLLKIFALSSFFVTLYSLFVPIQNIRMKVSNIVKLNLGRFIILVGLCYIFIVNFGITGIGYAWFVTYIILSIYILLSALFFYA